MINWMMGLFFILCMGMGARQPVNKPTEVVIPEVVVDTLEPIEVHIPKVFLTVTKCNNCTVAELDRIRLAEVKTNEVVRGECFKDSLSKMPLIETNGRTAAQVVEHILNSEVKIEAEMYWTVKRVLGYTLSGVNKEWINRRYMMSWGVCDLSSLLGHETAHKIGYGHSFRPTPTRHNTVPYSINKVFSTCCR